MKNVVIYSGSGISAESGIQTFRDIVDGLWYQYNVEEVATKQGWINDREKVLRFYNERRSQLRNVFPNKGHLDLVKLEYHCNVTIVTQNVDDLHERAGSTNIIHLHGELTKVRSTYSPTLIYPWGYKPLVIGDKCNKNSQLRPHVVWFGEELNEEDVSLAINKIKDADYIIIVGTSMAVSPANEFPFYNQESKTKYFFIDPSEFDDSIVPKRINFFKHIKEKATKGVELVIDEILLDL
jgi:NAD-dependent deacetylase